MIVMCKRGDIYYSDLGAVTGCCQCGIRPVVIVSNDTANYHSPTVTIVPLTSQIKKRNQPTHVILGQRETTGLSKPSLVLCEQVRSMDKAMLGNRVGRVISREAMSKITHALQVQIGAVAIRRA